MNAKATSVQVAAFIKRHYAEARSWPRHSIVPWVEWFMRRDFIGILRCGDGRIIAIGMARPVYGIPAQRDFYGHDENGTVVWIDLVASRSRAATDALGKLLRWRFPKADRIAFSRVKRAGAARVARISRLNMLSLLTTKKG